MSALVQFHSIARGGTFGRSDEINGFIPSLLKEIPCDKLINTCTEGTTLLHMLAKDDRIDYQLLFQDSKGPVEYDVVDSHGLTPLHYACRYGNKNAVQLLLRHGADPNIINGVNRNALMELLTRDINKDGVEILDALIQHKANLNQGNHPYPSALLSFVHEDYYYWYLSTDKQSRVAFLKKLVDSGADINAFDEYQNNALHFACKNGNIDFAKILVEAGCNDKQPNKYGNFPIDRMINREKKEQFLDFQQLIILR